MGDSDKRGKLAATPFAYRVGKDGQLFIT